MVDNEKVNSYQDALLDSFGIVAKQIVSELQYDKTILCQIVDDSKKSQGQYTVSDGNTKFIAYAESAEYRKDENVYVTIPNGDFNNEKFITGRKISGSTNIYNYKEPFDQIVDLTGNLNPFKDAVGELIANDEQRIEMKVAEFNLEENSNVVNYTWLGVKADFKSMIKNAMYGSYGLRIELITINSAVEPIIFDSSKFFGNAYNFITFTTQQQLFNIKGKDKIKQIKVYFYQTNNFISNNGEKIMYTKGQKLSNLFVNNIYICAGNDASEITDDVIEVYSLDGNSYNDTTDEKKELNLALRWIYKEQNKIVNVYDTNAIPVGYNIKWYRYSYNHKETTDFAGLFWEKIDNDNQLTYKLSTDLTIKEEKIQVIITRTMLNDEIIYRKSQVLVLSNETMPNVESDFIDFSNSLRIATDDDTDGYYYLYSESGPLISSAEADKKRYLIPEFKTDGAYKAITELNDGDQISWQFPVHNSMMRLYSQDGENDYIIDNDQISTELKPMYKINNQYIQAYSNNQVVCTLIKNGKSYQATKNFVFAPKYNLSSGYTMKIGKANDKQTDFANTNNFLVDRQQDYLIWKVYDELDKEILINNREFEVSLVNNNSAIFEDEQGELKNKLIITTGNIVKLKKFTKKDDLKDENNIYIVKIMDVSSKLTSYFSINLMTNDYFVSGPKEVIYLQNGKINYSQEPYIMYINYPNEEALGATYSLIPPNKGWELNGNNKLLPSNAYIQNVNYAIKITFGVENIILLPILNIQNTSISTSVNNVETSQIDIKDTTGAVKTIENTVFSALQSLGDNKYSGVIIGTYDGRQGIFSFDSTGQLVFEISAQTNGEIKFYDKTLSYYTSGSKNYVVGQ